MPLSRPIFKPTSPRRPINKPIALSLSALALLTALSLAPHAAADTPSAQTHAETQDRPVRINDTKMGSLLCKAGGHGSFSQAPMVQTDVNIKVSGPIIRTTLSQTFENTSDQWTEGVYVFPLPENAAVDRLRIVVGGRLIEGQIKEKKAARKIYEQAKSEGKKASLVEQERPNIFTASVANIGPHESVAIQIEYQDKAPIKDGAASLVFPMTITPRYSPPPQTIQIADADGRSVPVILDPVLDRARISPPHLSPALEPIEYLRLPVSITVELDAGFKLDNIESPYHPITVSPIDADSAKITLTEGEVPANRDFKLEWSAQNNDQPTTQIFKEVVGDDTYLMTLITPPKAEDLSQIPRRARETIFVIDTSGSMNGKSIAQARQALKLGLESLTAQDSFNVIRFASDFSPFFAKPIPATQANIARALRKTDRLEARGGTNMAPALDKAVSYKNQAEKLQQIIFITDGAIGNERQLFALIKDKLGDRRLFPVGIGSAPNRYFITRAATFGRGRARLIGNLNEVASEMGALFDDLSHPVMVNVSSSLSSRLAQNNAAFPVHLPDLYDGDPIMQIAKIPTASLETNYQLKGQYGAQTVNMNIDLHAAETGKGLNVLWAREKIRSLEEARFDRDNAANIDKEILQTALDHHIVSRLTSLVAVDVTPSRPEGESLNTAKVPTQLPDGWKFAQLAAKDTRAQAAPQRRIAPPPAPTSAQQVPVPQTASPHIAAMLLGLILMLLSRIKSAVNILARKRRAPHA